MEVTAKRFQPHRQPALFTFTTERIAMKGDPLERDVFRLEKTRQRGQTIFRQIDLVCCLQWPPRLVGDNLDTRVAHIQSVSVIDKVVSRF